jgi:hypothetical protein
MRKVQWINEVLFMVAVIAALTSGCSSRPERPGRASVKQYELSGQDPLKPAHGSEP